MSMCLSYQGGGEDGEESEMIEFAILPPHSRPGDAFQHMFKVNQKQFCPSCTQAFLLLIFNNVPFFQRPRGSPCLTSYGAEFLLGGGVLCRVLGGLV